MEIQLPPYEEIYDFNENELNHYYSSISKALESGVTLSEKWQRKANKIIELIQVELEERIVVNKITSFCDKELNSDLFQEIISENLTQASTDSRPDEPPNQELSEKIWNMRKNKKNYKDMVRNTLKNTHQGTEMKIGGSSVPIGKPLKIEENKAKPKNDIKEKIVPKAEYQKPVPVKKNIQGRNNIPPKAATKIEEKSKSDKFAKSDKIIKNDEKIRKASASETKAKEKKEIQADKIVDQVRTHETTTTGKMITDELLLSRAIIHESEDKRILPMIAEIQIETVSKELFYESEEAKSSGKESEDEMMENTIDLNSSAPFTKEASINLMMKTLTDSPSSHTLHQESINPPDSLLVISSKIEERKLSPRPENTEQGIFLESKKFDKDTVLSLEKTKISEEIPSSFQQSFSEIDATINSTSHEALDDYDSASSLRNIKNDEISLKNAKDAKDASFFQQLKEREAALANRLNAKSEAYEPDMNSLSELKALKDKIIQQKANIIESKTKGTLNVSISKEKLPEVPAEPKKVLQSKKSEAKLLIKPSQKPRTMPQSSVDLTDYSEVYDSFFDMFAGNKVSKEFNPLIALREVHTMFKEFLILLDSPEFDVHRKFKLSLAPLEVNPRDLVKGNELLSHSMPCDKEMYYRVVKARPEVYDIVSRGFNKKKGWSELPHGMNLRLSWNVMWTWSKPGIDMSKLLVWQKVNHFPETRNFSRKDLLKKNIEKTMKISQKCAQLWNIIPLTYVLPKEYLLFVDNYAKQEEENSSANVWIMKPVGKSRGRGISVINDVNQVSYGEIMIIQKYITNPLLLEGFKFDLRLYILITSFSPLEAFLYKEGFARMSTVPFSLNPDKLHNKFIHLTNASIQKHNQNSKLDSLDNILGGSKICLKTLIERLGKLGVNWDKIWQQIIELILKSLIAVQGEIPSYPCCFDLVGYDDMIDEDLQTWLVEINSSPSLARENYLDDLVKQQLIDDTLELVDPVYFNKIELLKVLDRRIGEVQKGHINNSVGQMNIDFNKILEGKRPRKYGELPSNIGNYEMISPSPLYEKLHKYANPRS